MKNNLNLVLIATAAFSYLFYDQNAGINFLVFNVLLISLALFRDPGLVSKRKWQLSAFMCLVTSAAIFINSSGLAVFANLCGMLLLSAYSYRLESSPLFSGFYAVYSVVGSVIHVFIDASKRTISPLDDLRGKKSYRYFTLFMAVLLSLLFFMLYRNSNPLFAQNTNWINLKFISLPWFVFTVFGFFVTYGLLNHKTFFLVEGLEHRLVLNNQAFDKEKQSSHQTEISSGIVLLIVLNLMLIVLNFGDARTILFNSGLPEGINHSDFVHDGVQLVIFSIVIAVGLIMFLSRRDFRSVKNYNTLKMLIYLWIIQNVFMLASTTYRNMIYIEIFDLTYLRIGVYVWLFLAIMGLCFTFLKVKNNKSIWYLIRTNFTAWLCCLALTSTISWDKLITNYNLRNKPLTKIDFNYLFSLSDSNIPELLSVMHSVEFMSLEAQRSLKQIKDPIIVPFTLLYKRQMQSKICSYLYHYETGWQSWDLLDNEVIPLIKNELHEN